LNIDIAALHQMARIMDGVRHVQNFGYWSSSGMTCDEVLLKYERRVRSTLGEGADDHVVRLIAYRMILERACETNALVDEMALKLSQQKPCGASEMQEEDSSRCASYEEILKRISQATEKEQSDVEDASVSSSSSKTRASAAPRLPKKQRAKSQGRAQLSSATSPAPGHNFTDLLGLSGVIAITDIALGNASPSSSEGILLVVESVQSLMGTALAVQL